MVRYPVYSRLEKKDNQMSASGTNLAFKCTYNDAAFRGICSPQTYEYNLSKGRAWCEKAKCRSFKGNPTKEDHPCYESILFTEWRFGAGWDHRKVERPRPIKEVKEGKIALLTTLEPNKEEKDRRIIGFLTIDRLEEGEEKETVVYGDPNKSLELDPQLIIRFWDYYKNLKAPERVFWGSGLFRYVQDKVILKFLDELKRIYVEPRYPAREIAKIKGLLNDYPKVPEPEIDNLAKAEATNSCPYCGHENLEQAKFCNKCGKVLGQKCRKCLTANPCGSRFCFECGTQLGGEGPNNASTIRDKLLEFGREEIRKPRQWMFTPDPKAERLIKTDPNAFLFAAILDQGIDAERAWAMPYELKKRLGHLDPNKITELNTKDLEEAFSKGFKIHRFWRTMARRIQEAARLLDKKYQQSAANIWANEPKCADVYDRLLEFDGIGQKKASMLTNILYRDLGVKLKEKSGIDVSYDEMVRRVFLRTGLVKKDTMNEVIDSARKLNPGYPGELDSPAWVIGRTWCLKTKPNCDHCYLNKVCPKLVV